MGTISSNIENRLRKIYEKESREDLIYLKLHYVLCLFLQQMENQGIDITKLCVWSNEDIDKFLLSYPRFDEIKEELFSQSVLDTASFVWRWINNKMNEERSSRESDINKIESYDDLLEYDHMSNDIFDSEDLKNYSKEELIDIIKGQGRYIDYLDELNKSPQNLINKRPSYPDLPDSLNHLVPRTRNGKQVEPYQSSIMLTEDKSMEKDDRISVKEKYSQIKKVKDLPDYRRTIIDYIKVILSLHRLGYFSKFDSEIDANNNGWDDLDNQRLATMEETINIFGRAVNMEDLWRKYHSEYYALFNKYEDNRNLVSKEDFLEVFERMKKVMEIEFDERTKKREEKERKEEERKRKQKEVIERLKIRKK